MGLKTGQNLPASGGHARSCDTAVRVLVRLDHGLKKMTEFMSLSL